MVRVSGIVVDVFDRPLSDVNIYVKSNPQNGAITNAHGQFQFSVTNTNEKLMFSHVGKETEELGIPANGNMGKITLIDNMAFDEVVVTGTPKPKSNNRNWLWWLVAGAALVGIAMTQGDKKEKLNGPVNVRL